MVVMLLSSAVGSVDSAPNAVTKVVNMLKKMQTTMQEEAEKDQEVYEKMSCWCETNDKETNAAVEAAQRAIGELTATIEEQAALAARLETEIEQLAAEIKSAQEAIATATEMRNKEHEAFSAEEKEMVETIAALTQAVEVLSKHNPGAFISVQTSLQRLKLGHLEGMKQRAQALLQQPAGYQSYNSRSGEIFGILKTMKEEFETNLKSTRADEAAAQARFEDLVAEKKRGIAAAQERKNTKTTEMSNAKSALVQAKADLKDVRSNLDADTKFLVDLKEKCSQSDKEFNERVKARQEEMAAVNEALGMLTDDNARDLFSSTLGFVQLKAVDARKKAVKVLKAAAAKTGSPMLSLLAQSAQLDAFTKVKKAIDEMIVELGQQQKDEVEHRDWCQGELKKNERQHQDKEWEAEDLTKLVNVLADKIETLDSEIAALQANVAENKRSVKRSSEDREAANAVFQQTIADQRATVAILGKVLARLQKVYEPEAAAAKTAPKAFLQQRQPQVKLGSRTADAAPEGFGGDYKKQAGGGVLGMIRMCIADAERLQQETLDAEQTQQTDYEKLVKDAAAEIAADNTSINDKTGERAQAEVDKNEASTGLEAANAAMEDLQKYATGVHASCDFVLNNFEIRQKARAEEIDALEDAKAILSGADFK